MPQEEAAGLMKLLQMTDSSFPVGGYAYSHGLEWLARQRALGEADLDAVLAAYVDQVAFGQWLPAARLAHRSTSTKAVVRCDRRLDASILAEGERNAGRAMGERLLVAASETFGGERTATLLREVRQGHAPGQYAVAFGAAGQDAGVEARQLLTFLAFSMLNSIAQAAVRLGLIGQAASARIVARAGESVEARVVTLLATRPAARFGAFTPGLDVAGILHPTLPFRMFAS